MRSCKIIPLAFSVLAAASSGAVAVNASRNSRAMRECLDETVERVRSRYTLRELDAGEYAEMKAFGLMKFRVKQYEVEGLGNLSVMSVNVGVMQMATLVLTPTEKELPLLSCDYMYMLSNRKAYIELYDLVKEKNAAYMAWMERYDAARKAYSDLSDTAASPGWYDDLLTVGTYKLGSPKDDRRIKGLLLDTVAVYLDHADACPVLTGAERAGKIARLKAYSDRLIDEGGISTDFFCKALGADTTRDFFDKVFFGTQR